MLSFLLLLALQQPQQVSVCSVLRRPSIYRHRVLSIPAEVLLALPHGAVLLDKDCSNRGIILGVNLPDADASVENLVPAILNNCSSDRRADRVAAVFIGRLNYSAKGRIELRLRSVEGLEAHSCDQLPPPMPVINPKPPEFHDR